MVRRREGVRRGRRTAFWIFTCDPKRYRLSDRLADPSPAISWLFIPYRNVMAPDDTVFLVEPGPRRASAP